MQFRLEHGEALCEEVGVIVGAHRRLCVCVCVLVVIFGWRYIDVSGD